jgi:hypothetical protein
MLLSQECDIVSALAFGKHTDVTNDRHLISRGTLGVKTAGRIGMVLIGKWHNSENNPTRLTDELKVQLQCEGGC